MAYKWSKVWAIQTDRGDRKIGDVIPVESSSGRKMVKVMAIVHRTTRSGKEFDLLFTEDVE